MPRFQLRHLLLTATTLACPLAVPAYAQDAADTSEPAEGNVIIVQAERQRGQVDTDIPPVIELNEEEIAAYGAGSIADLVEALAPQTSSGSGRGDGRPVFLVNGQRVGSFREFRRYPPEAIEKVEVLPEEVALQFGYPATQRVINFILKENFASREVEGEYGGPTAGGRATGEVEVSQLTINGANRLNLGAEFNTSSMLTEDERDIIQTEGSAPTVASDPDPARYRSLASDSESVELEATYNGSLGAGPGAGSYSINGNVQRDASRSLSGLDVVRLTAPDGTTEIRTLDDNPLTRRSRTTTLSTSGSIQKPLGDWQSNFTIDGVLTDTRTRTDRRRDTSALVAGAAAGDFAIDGALPGVADAGFDTADNRTYSVTSKATVNGNPLLLPAGEVSTTFDIDFDWKRIESDDTRSNAPVQLTRRRLSGGTNVNIPVAERDGAWGAIGDLGLNFGLGIEDVSDFGVLGTWSTGFNWRPTERFSFTGNYSYRDAAPSLTQLGAAQITDFNVPVYDLRNGETVLASVTTGGNPDLASETQRDLKLGANYEIDLFDRANLVVEYYNTSSRDVTSSFPLLTPAIEAAFADRVTRDTDGTLLAIDRRPITLAERDNSRIRYGFNLFGRVGRAAPEGAGDGNGNRRGGRFGAMAAAARPSDAPAQGGGFNREAFAAARAKFCATPDGEVPDISALPERMQERLRGENGQVDPERIAQARTRICSDDGAGGGMRGMDPEQFAALRKQFCENPTTPIDPATLPERIRERLTGPDGQIDTARLAEFRERFCALPAPQAQGEAAAQAERRGGGQRGGGGGGRGGRGGGGFGPGGGGDGQGRWNLSLYHTINLNDDVLIAPGVAPLDLLDGDALGNNGTPRHTVQLEGGVFFKGLGLRASANYEGKSRVDGSGLPGSSDLYFGDLATLDLRLFANLEELAGEEPGFLKGTRLSLRANNIFDTRREVRDENGVVPLSYQPGLIDPIGRFVEIEFRKVF
ncbi:TonB-dependent receptor plug domain-containing protein [Altererythrobacter sp. CAU 1778]